MAFAPMRTSPRTPRTPGELMNAAPSSFGSYTYVTPLFAPHRSNHDWSRFRQLTPVPYLSFISPTKLLPSVGSSGLPGMLVPSGMMLHVSVSACPIVANVPLAVVVHRGLS